MQILSKRVGALWQTLPGKPLLRRVWRKKVRGYFVFCFKEGSPEEKKSICPRQAGPLLDVPSVTTREQ